MTYGDISTLCLLQYPIGRVAMIGLDGSDWYFHIVTKSLQHTPKKTVYLVTCGLIQGIPTPLPLLVTSLMVTNV